MITTDLKLKVVEALESARNNFGGSDAKFATSMGIAASAFSRLRKGEIDRVISDAMFISLARKLDVATGFAKQWKVAATPVFNYVMEQLEFCQQNAASRILCDAPDIGKTFTAKHYVKAKRHAVYIDCSQVKSKQRLVRAIAQQFGVNSSGRYSDVYADLVFYLRTLPNPLIILDEAGDLDYQAFLELKALWNATERSTGWYMMGADGLKEKIRRSIDHKKVGYAELFSRFGNRYQKASPDTDTELKQFKTVHAAMILQVNAPEFSDVQKLIIKSDYSLRRIYDEVNKQQIVA
jgi:DNA transposition AAA+ family ATPase